MNTSKKIAKLTILLQYQLEQMTENELAQFLNEHDLEYNGKIYGRESHAKTTSTKQQNEEVSSEII
jgi:hypothetical protein